MIRKNAPAGTITKTVLSLSAIGLLLSGAMLYAGPLNPPAGPVAPTYKTLTEVEPRIVVNAANTPGDNDSLFKITQPGSYYLVGNIIGEPGKHGIEIVASGVTLDLNGFDLVGSPAPGFFDGVCATAPNLTNIVVVNGSVRGWSQNGINLGTQGVTGSRIEGVAASGNLQAGIYSGVNAVVSNCSGSGGQYGISARTGSVVSNCSATGASSAGIHADAGCTLINCSAYLNNSDGIASLDGCTISNCSAYDNSGNGINAGTGSTVENCNARVNSLDGIRCSSQGVIRGNTSTINGSPGDGAGIHATGGRNRIEGNTCIGSDRGIDIDAAGNIIISNTCSGNTTMNWDIVANNYYGPIIDRTGIASGAVNGNAAPDSTGTTHPQANFTY